jgi:hypothetical protein
MMKKQDISEVKDPQAILPTLLRALFFVAIITWVMTVG